jgi:hypothetical protein
MDGNEEEKILEGWRRDHSEPGVNGFNLLRGSRISSCFVQRQPKPSELEVVSLP